MFTGAPGGIVSAESPEGAADDAVQARQVVGWLLNIRVYPERMLMKAKLDSGARTSAIHAENIRLFEDDDGQQMVSFVIRDDHGDPQSDVMELLLPLEREVNIKLRYTDDSDARPVVRLEFCMAGKRHSELFSLADRSRFNYPVLLGREFLKHEYLIDPSESFTHRTACRRK